jgi:hypothetical protein
MTVQQFHTLTEIEKIAAIMQYGRLLAQGVEDEYRIFLYQFDTFYVTTKYRSDNDSLKEIDIFLEVNQAIPHFRKKIISIHPAGRIQDIPAR